MVNTMTRNRMARLTGMDHASAAVPARISTKRISSVAYATEEIELDEKMARASRLESRSCAAWAVLMGSPTSQRLRIMARIIAQSGWEQEEKKPCDLRQKTQSTRPLKPGRTVNNTSGIKGIDSLGKLAYLSGSLATRVGFARGGFVRYAVFFSSALIYLEVLHDQFTRCFTRCSHFVSRPLIFYKQGGQSMLSHLTGV